MWSWGKQSSPAVYGSITDGKVRISGTADVDFSPAIEGRGVAPLQGTSGIVFSPLVRGTGTLRKFTGTAYSTSAKRPRIVVDYTEAPPPEFAHIKIGSGSVTLGGNHK